MVARCHHLLSREFGTIENPKVDVLGLNHEALGSCVSKYQKILHVESNEKKIYWNGRGIGGFDALRLKIVRAIQANAAL